jgi:hypothetical protein
MLSRTMAMRLSISASESEPELLMMFPKGHAPGAVGEHRRA